MVMSTTNNDKNNKMFLLPFRIVQVYIYAVLQMLFECGEIATGCTGTYPSSSSPSLYYMHCVYRNRYDIVYVLLLLMIKNIESEIYSS